MSPIPSAVKPRHTSSAHGAIAGLDWALGVLDADILYLGIAGEGFEALLPSVTALLIAAGWKLHATTGSIRVHVHLAGLDPVRQEQGLVDVAGPHARHQAVHTVVGDRSSFFEIIEGNDGEHRAEDLFLCHAHISAHVVE